MRSQRFDSEALSASGRGAEAGQARAMDMRPDIPFSTDKIVGIDLTHIIHTSQVAAAKGGPGGGGGSGGGGGTTYPSYISGAADGKAGYDIQIDFVGTSWTQALHDVFVTAADRLTSLILGDVQDVSVRSRGKVTNIDDIVITAELGEIDGLYGILGQAGPTSVRTTGSLPATAQMQFDIADVNDMGLAMFAEVVLHEMAHSLGSGSIWDRLGLVSNGEFTGPKAVGEYHKLGGTRAGIPVEQDGGSGTAGSHWDEETFNNELMTGYINNGDNPFSEMTAASFGDLGYTLAANYGGVAEDYTMPVTTFA